MIVAIIVTMSFVTLFFLIMVAHFNAVVSDMEREKSELIYDLAMEKAHSMNLEVELQGYRRPKCHDTPDQFHSGKFMTGGIDVLLEVIEYEG